MDLSLNSDTKRLVCLAVLLGIYLLSGAAVFQVLENEKEVQDVSNMNTLRHYFHKKYNISSEDFEVLVEKVEKANKYMCGGPPESWCISRWSYYASLYFTWSVVTTIGYGHLAPSTLGGRVFCMIFALFGIPLNLMILKNIGDRVKDLIHYVHYTVDTKLFKREGQILATYTLAWTLGFVVIMLLIGALFYAQTEHWNYFDGIYFCFVTFSTIGFGDLVPNQGGPPTTVAEVVLESVRAFVVVLGLSMFFSIISSILTASEELRITFPMTRTTVGPSATRNSEETAGTETEQARDTGTKENSNSLPP